MIPNLRMQSVCTLAIYLFPSDFVSLLMSRPRCSYFPAALGLSSSTMFFGSFHASATYLVWLPLANTSPFSVMNRTEVKASVFPNLSHVTSASILSPILPPLLRYVTSRSVETPVLKSPREATAREPPRSTRCASCQTLCSGFDFVSASRCRSFEVADRAEEAPKRVFPRVEHHQIHYSHATRVAEMVYHTLGNKLKWCWTHPYLQ